jgi:hypothetical protein
VAVRGIGYDRPSMTESSEIEFRAPREPLVAPGGSELHERDMTATFSADVTLAAAQAQLAHLGQWLPIDGDASWTLGRLVELNSTGPLRLGYGAWRDLLLGCQFLNGNGELITAGGRTVKNVAGYDLTKFMVGQGGVFGRLVTITTRTYRRPAGSVVARFGAEAGRIHELLPTACRPQWAVLTGDALWCGYLGDERTMAFYREQLGAFGPEELTSCSIEEEIGRRFELWRYWGADGSFRASVPPARVREFTRGAGLGAWSADAAFGIVTGLAEGRDREIVAATRGVSGSVYFFAGGRVRAALDAGRRAMLERLKAAFDLAGKLEPLPGM